MIPGKRVVLMALVTVGIMMVMTGAVQAESPRKPVAFGLYIGPSITSQWSTAEASPEYSRTTGNESGVTLGLFVGFSLGKLFAIQAEFMFVEKGGNHTISVAGFPYGDLVVTYSMDYIEIPVLLKFIPLKTKSINFYSQAGIYLAFLTDSSYRFENEIIPDFNQDLGDLKKSDLGLAGGAGISFSLKNVNLHAEYRYSMGLVDLAFPTGPGFPEIELRNLGHKILCGISFER